MTKYLFNEGIVWEDSKKGSYIVPYIIGFIILALVAASAWLISVIVSLLNSSDKLVPDFLITLDGFFATPVEKIIVCAAAGIIALILLFVGIRNLKTSRFMLTPRRVCMMRGSKNYREVRLDKIDAIFVNGRKIKIFAGGKKVISFGPVEDPYATRNAVVGLIGFEIKPPEDESIVFDKAVPMYKEQEEDVFDGDVIQ
ncbi:MAG: hypothetical protein Q4Q53_01515 [Methanocorpusculum sp.]|nr:hypothetical protein [Methanocorpusculum sp.]